MGNIGLAEPLRVYSNVAGGTGILGGNQHSETTITLNNPSKKFLIMDTLQQTPALWYWSEPASGYSIEDCEQIVAEEMQTAKAD